MTDNKRRAMVMVGLSTFLIVGIILAYVFLPDKKAENKESPSTVAMNTVTPTISVPTGVVVFTPVPTPKPCIHKINSNVEDFKKINFTDIGIKDERLSNPGYILSPSGSWGADIMASPTNKTDEYSGLITVLKVYGGTYGELTPSDHDVSTVGFVYVSQKENDPNVQTLVDKFAMTAYGSENGPKAKETILNLFKDQKNISSGFSLDGTNTIINVSKFQSTNSKDPYPGLMYSVVAKTVDCN